MQSWTDTLTRKQARAARAALRNELRIASHVQARRSEIDGWATVEVFMARSCYTATIGPRGGIKRVEKTFVK